jgi:prenyltransferase beta subunit
MKLARAAFVSLSFLVASAPAPVPARVCDPVSELARLSAEKGVQWLLGAQNRDGSWGDNPGSPGEVGNTSIACLALLAHGSTATRGLYCMQVRRGLDWLAKRTRNYSGGNELDSMTLLHRKLGNNADLYLVALLYSQALSLNVEAWEDQRMQQELGRMVAHVGALQKQNGEWETSYEPMLTTIAAWQALKQAHAAGITIDHASPQKVVRYLREDCLEQNSGVFRENKWGRQQRFVTQAGGVRVLVGEGLGGQPDVQRAIDVIDKMRFDQDVGGATGGEEFLGALYATQALLLERDKVYQRWYDRITKALKSSQNTDGSWVGHHCITGRVFCTACSIMTLLTPDRLLPLAER